MTTRTPSDTNTRPATSGQRVSRRLVALSSTVVLAVYSAGYLRTQAAADRFAAEADQRRPIVPTPARHVQPDPSAGPTTPAAPIVISEPVAVAAATPSAPARSAVVAAAAPSTPGVAAAPAEAPTATSAPAAPVASMEATPAVAPESVAAAVTTTTPAVASAAAPSATPAVPRYKDGTHTGWGTSRHGDIQAQVVIANGRITSATITQCMTRWPCSWVEALPGQVVARQSAETDYVSGATQSTNAFYYAVVQALGKAALP